MVTNFCKIQIFETDFDENKIDDISGIDVVNQNFSQIFIIQLENFSFLSFYIFLVSFN